MAASVRDDQVARLWESHLPISPFWIIKPKAVSVEHWLEIVEIQNCHSDSQDSLEMASNITLRIQAPLIAVRPHDQQLLGFG